MATNQTTRHTKAMVIFWSSMTRWLGGGTPSWISWLRTPRGAPPYEGNWSTKMVGVFLVSVLVERRLKQVGTKNFYQIRRNTIRTLCWSLVNADAKVHPSLRKTSTKQKIHVAFWDICVLSGRQKHVIYEVHLVLCFSEQLEHPKEQCFIMLYHHVPHSFHEFRVNLHV